MGFKLATSCVREQQKTRRCFNPPLKGAEICYVLRFCFEISLDYVRMAFTLTPLNEGQVGIF